MKEGSGMTTETLDARRFRALQQDWPSEDLARFFLLTPEDMQEVRTCRGAANRLGFALNLLLLRLLHCPLSEVNLTPVRIIQFVAMQLNVHPEVLAEYSTRRPQTRDEHLVQIRGYLKLRPWPNTCWLGRCNAMIRLSCSKKPRIGYAKRVCSFQRKVPLPKSSPRSVHRQKVRSSRP